MADRDDSQFPEHTPIEQVLIPFNKFFKIEASGGIVLLACTLVALFLANSPFADAYNNFWQAKFTLGFGAEPLSKPLLLWVNDGLMAIFFFLVGLEIKREILVGELKSLRKAILPILAAIGGMVVPALIFVFFNMGKPSLPGWGIPMATDIAFALGIMSLLGDRVPLSLKIFLTAVAIVDDIGAVLVIAFFYTSQLSVTMLFSAFGIFCILIGLCLLQVRKPFPYILLAAIMWFFFLKSGVHATIAGVLAAMTLPSRTRRPSRHFVEKAQNHISNYDKAFRPGETVLSNKEQHSALQGLVDASLEAETPLQRLEHTLHPWVAYFIMPVFALANAGVVLNAQMLKSIFTPLPVGIFLGLIVGKQVGIMLAAWLALKFNIAERPPGVSIMHYYGASWLAGIGFTMSIFIATLAFDKGNPMVETAKLGIIAASFLAGTIGWLILRLTPVSKSKSG